MIKPRGYEVCYKEKNEVIDFHFELSIFFQEKIHLKIILDIDCAT